MRKPSEEGLCFRWIDGKPNGERMQKVIIYSLLKESLKVIGARQTERGQKD
jgi:hypothetical protein